MKNRLMVTIGLLVVLILTLLTIKSITTIEKEENKPQEKQEEVIKKEEVPDVVKPAEKEPEEMPEVKPEVKDEPVEMPEVELTPQEQAREELIEKYGAAVVEAWEKLSRDDFFDYIGYELTVQEEIGPEGDLYYPCYKILEDGSITSAHVGGSYYIYGVFVSDEAIFDLVDYHNEFFAIK